MSVEVGATVSFRADTYGLSSLQLQVFYGVVSRPFDCALMKSGFLEKASMIYWKLSQVQKICFWACTGVPSGI